MAKYLIRSLFLSIFLAGGLPSMEGQTYLTASLSIPANAGILAETCGGAYELIIVRGEDNPDTTLIFISDLGVAQAGSDYSFPPGAFPLEMLPDDTVAVIPVNVVNDGMPEGLETLIWEIAYLAGLESGVVNVESGIVDDYEVEIISASDTINWCRYAPLQLMASSTAEITWSPTFYFDDPFGPEVTARPFQSGWVYASVGTEECEAKDSVYLDLAIVEIGEADTLFICLDEMGITLEGSLDGLAEDFEWIPSDDNTLSDPNSLTPVANPLTTTTYILQSDIGVCIAADTVTVQVDSLPDDLHIDIAPLKVYYCAGEIVALFSPSYDTLLYPDLTFLWGPDNNTYLSSQELLNTALQLQDTTLYIRENINNGCLSKDSILINVVPSGVPLSVTDTMLCPGEQFDVEVLNDQVVDPEWTPEEGLSCTQCLNPTVTVNGQPGSTIAYMFSGMILDCPVGAVLPITIPPFQAINIEGDLSVCNGDMTALTVTNPEDLSGYSWVIQSGDASLSCTNCPDPVVTVNSTAPASVLLTVTANTTNPDFCGAQGVVELIVGSNVNVGSRVVDACQGDTITVSTGNPDYFNASWTIISGSLALSCTSCDFPVVTVNSPGRLRFIADINSPDTCGIVGELIINTYGIDGSGILITPDPNGTEIGQGSEVSAFLSVSPPPASILWTVNGTSATSTENTITFNAEEEVNFVSAEFINQFGCLQIDTISFTTVPPTYSIPNAFTPNNDDLNDVFRIIINGNITVEKFMIFNRWGQKVYDAEDGATDGWDGRFKAEPAASDTYVYTATLRYPDGRSEIAKGDVILLR